MPENRLKPWTREAAVDLGVRVAASLSIDGAGSACHFLGRDLLKDWDYWGRRIAGHMAELADRPKGERSSRRLRRLYRKRRARWEHAWEGLAAQMISVLEGHRVGCVYLGWPKEIRRDRSYGSKWNGRIHNFWSFEKALRILEKHCARAGVVAIRVGERGSSSVCPACDSSEVIRAPRHVLRCRACGLKLHSDQAGSRNILRQQNPEVMFPNTPGSSRDGAEAAAVRAPPKPETRRWSLHRWVDASNPLNHERPAA
jgi:transposase